jgi:hypothetical protein
MTKKTETADETLERLAKDADEGASAAKRFESLLRRVLKTPKSAIDTRAKAWKQSRKAKA